MDVEFHYYMTYLIAVRAGFSPVEARTIAHAAQYVDDNCTVRRIYSNGPGFYRNYISQTMNILRPKERWTRIYTHFHFIPGDIAKSSRRIDGRTRKLNTTPDSKNANRIFDAAIRTGNLYRIGIACHSFADSWAHQNFVGTRDKFNKFPGVRKAFIPNIGHADAEHDPDWAAHKWVDPRLRDPQINNKARFLASAKRIFAKFHKACHPAGSSKTLQKNAQALLSDLDLAIGPFTKKNQGRSQRIERYRRCAREKVFGNQTLPEYNEKIWLHEATRRKPIRAGGAGRSIRTVWKRVWRSPRYKQTHWHQFQAAVMGHQEKAWELLGPLLRGIVDKNF